MVMLRLLGLTELAQSSTFQCGISARNANSVLPSSSPRRHSQVLSAVSLRGALLTWTALVVKLVGGKR